MKKTVAFIFTSIISFYGSASWASVQCTGFNADGQGFTITINPVETGVRDVIAEQDGKIIFSGTAKAYQTGDGTNGYYYTKYRGIDSENRELIFKVDSNKIYSVSVPTVVEELNCVTGNFY